MPRERPFLDSIIEDPEDDTPRLVFADWLEEQGEEDRAQFIRVQCEHEQLPSGNSKRPELRRIAMELLVENESRWLADWKDKMIRWDFHRGFLRDVVMLPQDFLAHSDRLFKEQPVIGFSFLESNGTPISADAVPELVSSSNFSFVRSLNATGCNSNDLWFGMYSGRHPGEAWCRELARATHIQRLEELNLSSGLRDGFLGTTASAFLDLCRANHLRTLRKIDLTHVYQCELGDIFLSHMIDSSFLDGLEVIVLNGLAITDEGISEFVNCGRTGNLRSLGLGHCPLLSEMGLRTTLNSKNLPNLVDLAIDSEEEFVNEVANSTQLNQLTHLSLLFSYRGQANRPTTQTFEKLAASEVMLKHLVLADNTVAADVYAIWLQSPNLANLEQLWLSTQGVDDEGLIRALTNGSIGGKLEELVYTSEQASHCEAMLRDWSGLKHLRSLGLGTGFMDSWGNLIKVLESPNMSSGLEKLSLEMVTDEEIIWLSNWEGGTTVKYLSAPFSSWTELAGREFFQSPYWQGLQSLQLSSEYSDSKGVALLSSPEHMRRLNDVVIGSQSTGEIVASLTRRFGPKLRVFADC